MNNRILKEILNLKTDLNDLIRLGSPNDGGYVVNKSSLDNCDVLYTYGVSNDYNFELDFIKRYPNKIVRMFDHTVDYPSEVSKQIFFLKEPLSINEDDSVNSLISHINYYKDNNKKIFLKIDVEGYEYDFFLKLSKNFNVLKNMTGLVMEIHSLGSIINYVLFQKIINKLHTYFDITHVHGNNHGPSFNIEGAQYPEALELSFCSIELSKNFNTTSMTYPVKGLDFPCNKNIKDFDIFI